MTKIEEIFTLLRTLINSTTKSTIAINKFTLSTVITCLQVTHKKVDMFKLQNKLLFDELSFLQHQHCDLNILQNNKLIGLHIYKQNDIKDESEFNEYIQLINDDTRKHEDELDEVPIIGKVMDKCNEEIRIVCLWEELQFKHNRYGLGYKKA